MAEINLSKAVRSNLSSLQNVSAMMSKTQDRLSTGNKVNSALDNPTNFFTASSLNSRAGDLNNLMDSMANGIKTIEAADNGLSALTKSLESMQSTLRQARQDKSFETKSFNITTLDPSGAGKLSFSGGAFTGTTDFGLTTVGSGQYGKTSADYAAPTAAAASTVTGAANLTTGAVTAGTMTIKYDGKSVDVAITARAAGDNKSAVLAEIQSGLAGTALDGKVTASISTNFIKLDAASSEDGQITVTNDAGGTATSVMGANKTGTTGSDAKFEFSINGTAVTLDRATTGADKTTATAEINAQLKAAGSKFEAYVETNKVGIRATTTDAGNLSIGGKDANLFGTVAANGTVGGTTSASLTLVKTLDNLVSEMNSNASLKDNIKASNDNGKLRIQNLSTRDLTVQGTNAAGNVTGNTSAESTITGNTVRSDLASQFNELRDQLDKLSDDASFNGINLLRGDKLKITFNETGTSSIDIQSKNGQSIDAAKFSLSNLAAKDLDSDTNIDSLTDKVKGALNNVRSQASAFGSNLSIVQNRQDFTKSMINTLETGAGNLTLADMNQEAANMMALQTRQSLASSTLSMANQADQGVLQLLR
ncbi:flagellin [Devosia psychrophila]|uniref:Flagellin n=1 Tax=Devosia psychrophila TaxID=728005 RepID=A0A0F5Q0V4_9HYPH|nr:flagellin [Devosia psychrophila]KKC34515.1 hypothetical protein WH91_02450 [Devosia psychrophila]SFC57671.1 Flagellin FlgL [Devosia psychrophila]